MLETRTHPSPKCLMGGNCGCLRKYTLDSLGATPMRLLQVLPESISPKCFPVLPDSNSPWSSHSKAVGHMRPVSDKYSIYRSLFILNQGFEIVLAACTRLKSLGCMTDDKLRSCTLMAEELRALANSNVADVLNVREDEDCTRLQNLRHEWETRLKVQGENMPWPWPVPTRRTAEPKATPSKRPQKSTPKKSAG